MSKANRVKTMFDLLSFFIGCLVGFYVGWKINDRLHTSITTDLFKAVGVDEIQLKRAIDNLQSDLASDSENNLPRVEVKVEQIDGQIFVYRLDNSEFLCQGVDRESVLACLADRFRADFTIVLSEEHGAQYLKESPGT